MKKTRRTRLEALEARAVLNVGPIDLMTLDTDREAWTLRDDDGTATVEIVDNGDSTRWTPEIYGDFNSDGVDDVLGRLDNGDWWLQVNDGTKLYNSPWRRLTAMPADAEILGEAQASGDDLLDVISLDRSTGEIWVSLNVSGAGFLSQVWGTLPVTDLQETFVGDFTGDGLTDLLVVDAEENFHLARNTDGAFAIENWGQMPFFSWVNVLSGDFNGDGRDDVAARAPDNTWWVWFASDTRMEAARFWGHWGQRDTWHDVATADFTGDGKDDVIGRTQDGRLWVGTATDTRFHTWTWNEGWVDRANWANVTHIDLNEDGFMDQVGMAKDNTWWYGLNTGAARFHNFFWQEADPGDFHFFADNFQRDEAVDVVAALPTGGANIPDAEAFATLNADGKIELTPNQEGLVLVGIDFMSPSGALNPLSEEADPFDIPIVVSETQITTGNLGPGIAFDEPIALEIGWDDGANDLVPSYGVESDQNVRTAIAYQPLGLVPMPIEDTQEEYNAIYYQTIPEDRVRFPEL